MTDADSNISKGFWHIKLHGTEGVFSSSYRLTFSEDFSKRNPTNPQDLVTLVPSLQKKETLVSDRANFVFTRFKNLTRVLLFELIKPDVF
jgi:hypothetical protein